MLAAGFLINRGVTPSNNLPYFMSFVSEWAIVDLDCWADWLFVRIISNGWVEIVDIMPAIIPDVKEFRLSCFPCSYRE